MRFAGVCFLLFNIVTLCYNSVVKKGEKYEKIAFVAGGIVIGCVW